MAFGMAIGYSPSSENINKYILGFFSCFCLVHALEMNWSFVQCLYDYCT